MTHTPIDDPTALRQFRERVRRWYRRNGRDLPWKDETDAYRVWVREIMLQQTTVAAVVPYLERFFAAFPDIATLAGASEADVLKLWEGLGYYSRARNLRRAAGQVVVAGGEIPRTVDELQQLPGIGRYTAGAIASFAYGVSAPIVEANTRRLFARLLCIDEDLTGKSASGKLWAFAEAVVPARTPGRFNQALMDLGATVCTASEPNCETCPIKAHCRAFGEGRVADVPAMTRKQAFIDQTDGYFVVVREGKWLLRQRPAGELWQGLWDLPRVTEIDVAGVTKRAQQGTGKRWGEQTVVAAERATLERLAAEQFGIEIHIAAYLGEIRHAVTKYRMRVRCYRSNLHRGDDALHDLAPAGFTWIDQSALASLAMTKPARTLVNRTMAMVGT